MCSINIINENTFVMCLFLSYHAIFTAELYEQVFNVPDLTFLIDLDMESVVKLEVGSTAQVIG